MFPTSPRVKRLSLAALAGLLGGCAVVSGPCSYTFDFVADGAASEAITCSAGGTAQIFVPSRPLLVVDRMERDAAPLLRQK